MRGGVRSVEQGDGPVPLHDLATWRSGYAAACKAVYTGSIPVVALRAVSGRLRLILTP